MTERRGRSRALRFLFALAGAFALLVIFLSGDRTAAQVAQGNGSIDPAVGVEQPVADAGRDALLAPATRRTMKQALRAQARGFGPSPLAAASKASSLRFLPTMDESEYLALKRGEVGREAGALAPGGARGQRPLSPGLLAQEPEPLAPPGAFTSCEGVNNAEAGPFVPPDPHGAVGISHFVEVTNTHLDIYEKATCERMASVSLNAFFGYEAQPLFDPRVLYDLTFDRWLIYAEAFPQAPTQQFIFLAVSTSGNPLGPYFRYAFDANIFGDDFWDYGQLGMDHDAILFTANIFRLVDNDPLIVDGFKFARFWAWPKLELYSGRGFVFCFFDGLVGTTAPSIVLDRNPRTFMVAAPPSGSTVFRYTVRDSARLCPEVMVSLITVPAYIFPPNALQPGTPVQLDTLDSRFVNAGTQVGNALYQVHSVSFFGLPTPRWYQFNTGVTPSTITQEGFFFASATSHDWNASITGNVFGDVFVNWSSTDGFGRGVPPTNAQVRFSGRNAGDALGFIGPGMPLFTSLVPYNLQVATFFARWGDYSAVTLDPTNTRRAWLVNQKNNTTSIWGTRFGQIGY